MPAPDLLLELLRAPGPSGQEREAAAVWRRAAEAFADVSGDAVGNTVARVAGTGDGPRLAAFAHVDEIALTITHVDESGLLSVRQLGGVNPQVLVAQRVDVLAREGRVPGVLAAAIEPGTGKETKRVELKDLHVDVGARSADEARALVRIGDPVLIAGEPVELRNGRLAARALDNRVGAYVALEAARRVAEAGGAPGEFVAVATVEEEVGDYLGARAGAFSLEPDVALAVDITLATDAPGVEAKDSGELKLGGGPVLARGPGIPPALFDRLWDTAEAEGIACAVEVSRGSSMTDADAVNVSRAGVPVGVVSVPIRYAHTPVELVDLADVEAAIRLLVAFARGLDASADFSRSLPSVP